MKELKKETEGHCIEHSEITARVALELSLLLRQNSSAKQ